MYRQPEFPPDATESDCAALVTLAAASSTQNEPADAGEAKTFALLMKRWVNFAYAGRTPPKETFEAALAFCKSLGARHA
jgi:hypothetical protein